MVKRTDKNYRKKVKNGRPRKRDPWDRLEKGEGPVSYQYFVAYRDMPPNRRSVVRVARKFDSVPQTLYNISSRCRWSERVDAWDLECQRLSDGAKLSTIQQLNREHLTELRGLRVLLSKHVGELQIQAEQGELEELTLPEIARAYKDVAVLERLIAGQATERVVNQNLHLDIEQLSGDEAEQLLNSLNKIGALGE